MASTMVSGSAQTVADIEKRDQLIADQANLLNAYRCMFDVDTEIVPGGCIDGSPAGPKIVPGPFAGPPTQQDLEIRDQLVADQENLLNIYRCMFDVDTEIVPGGCIDGSPAVPNAMPTTTPAPTPTPQPSVLSPPRNLSFECSAGESRAVKPRAVLRWDAPESGTPASYAVSVERLGTTQRDRETITPPSTEYAFDGEYGSRYRATVQASDDEANSEIMTITSNLCPNPPGGLVRPGSFVAPITQPVVPRLPAPTATPSPTRDPDTEPLPTTPVVSIAARADVVEGFDMVFTLRADPVPSAALNVRVALTASGNFGVDARTVTVTIPVSGTATLTLSTDDDSTDEPDGSVTATVNAGRGYTRSATDRTATIAVADNDTAPTPPPTSRPTATSRPTTPPGNLPVASVVAKFATVTEGDDVSFTVSLRPAPESDASEGPDTPGTFVFIRWVTTNCDGRISGPSGDDSILVGLSGSAESALFSTDDGVSNGDCSVVVTLLSDPPPGSKYTIPSENDPLLTARVAVNDPPSS
ncbi:MAG: hypothetical protein OXF64_04615 [bacterium]|nr:hypothetical protein [bacterium]